MGVLRRSHQEIERGHKDKKVMAIPNLRMATFLYGGPADWSCDYFRIRVLGLKSAQSPSADRGLSFLRWLGHSNGIGFWRWHG